MPHKYRALIGRQSPRPASRGIIAYPEPRRRNCRRAISLAARWQSRRKQLLRPFVCLQKDVAARYSAKRRCRWPADIPAYTCSAFGRVSRCSILPRWRLRPRPLTRAPEGQAYVPAVHPPKRPFSRRQAKNAGGVFRRHRFGWAKIRFSSYSRSAQGRFLR